MIGCRKNKIPEVEKLLGLFYDEYVMYYPKYFIKMLMFSASRRRRKARSLI